MCALLRQPFDDLVACMDGIARAQRPYLALAATVPAMLVAWLVYTPVHELLHVAGCVATGGTVSRLEIQPIYGGALLARVFPFVVPGGEYAGRLSGFDTGGSDLVYLATDAAPYLLTVLFGAAVRSSSVSAWWWVSRPSTACPATTTRWARSW